MSYEHCTPRRPTALLRHELLDGSAHYDWMLAQDAAGILPLITFRLPYRLDELDAGASFTAERIDDHRPTYLRQEGELSGGRGSVERVRAGAIVSWREQGEDWELLVRWAGDDVQRVAVERVRSRAPCVRIS